MQEDAADDPICDWITDTIEDRLYCTGSEDHTQSDSTAITIVRMYMPLSQPIEYPLHWSSVSSFQVCTLGHLR